MDKDDLKIAKFLMKIAFWKTFFELHKHSLSEGHEKDLKYICSIPKEE